MRKLFLILFIFLAYSAVKSQTVSPPAIIDTGDTMIFNLPVYFHTLELSLDFKNVTPTLEMPLIFIDIRKPILIDQIKAKSPLWQDLKSQIGFLAVAGVAYGLSKVEYLPMKYDAPNTRHGSASRYDKLDHFASHALLTFCIPSKKYNIDFWASVAAGFIFELNDSRLVNRDVTLGFSRMDFILGSVAGSMFGVWLKDLFHQFGVYVLVNKNGISFHW